ncbi:hypothetical protein CRE_06751 [Caenorhabditis remanei]|uniref:K Homology domain-containing protein n=1 Tax=Caenorhabditis remanei TaxID=31234 RepID=E3MNY6_CAERE|nr:hypothetical protein CRE_06751 [Caenorhabditis remanei]
MPAPKTESPTPSTRPARENKLPWRLTISDISKSAPASLKRRAQESSSPVVIQKAKAKKTPKKSARARPAPATPVGPTTARAATSARAGLARAAQLPARYREEDGPSSLKIASKKNRKSLKKAPKKKIPKKKEDSVPSKDERSENESSDEDEDSESRKVNKKKMSATPPHTVAPSSSSGSDSRANHESGPLIKKRRLDTSSEKMDTNSKEDDLEEEEEKEKEEEEEDTMVEDSEVEDSTEAVLPLDIEMEEPTQSIQSTTQASPSSETEMEDQEMANTAQPEITHPEHQESSLPQARQSEPPLSASTIKFHFNVAPIPKSLVNQTGPSTSSIFLNTPGKPAGEGITQAFSFLSPTFKGASLTFNVPRNVKQVDSDDDEKETPRQPMPSTSQFQQQSQARISPFLRFSTAPIKESPLPIEKVKSPMEAREERLLRRNDSEPTSSQNSVSKSSSRQHSSESRRHQGEVVNRGKNQRQIERKQHDNSTSATRQVKVEPLEESPEATAPTKDSPLPIKKPKSVMEEREERRLQNLEKLHRNKSETTSYQNSESQSREPGQKPDSHSLGLQDSSDSRQRHGEVVNREDNQVEREQHESSTTATRQVKVEQLEESPEEDAFSEMFQNLRNQSLREYFEALSRRDSGSCSRASEVRDVRDKRSDSHSSRRDDSERPSNSDSSAPRQPDSFEERRQHKEAVRREGNQRQEARSKSRGPQGRESGSRRSVDVDSRTERKPQESPPATRQVKTEEPEESAAPEADIQNQSRREDVEAPSRREDSVLPSRASEVRDDDDSRLDSRFSHRPDSERPVNSDSGSSRRQNSFEGRRQHAEADRYENSTPATRQVKKEELEESPAPEVGPIRNQSRREDVSTTSRSQDSVSCSRASEPRHRSDSRFTNRREERHHDAGRSEYSGSGSSQRQDSRASEVRDVRNRRSDSRSSRRPDSERPGTSDYRSSRRQDYYDGRRPQEEAVRREGNQRQDAQSRSSGQASNGDVFRRQPETDRRTDRTSYGNYGNNDNRSRNSFNNRMDERRVVYNQGQEDIPSTSRGPEARRSDHKASERSQSKTVVGDGKRASLILFPKREYVFQKPSNSACWDHVTKEQRELLLNEGIVDVRAVEKGKASYIKSDASKLTARDLEELATRQARTLRARSESGRHPISEICAGYVKFLANDIRNRLGLVKLIVGDKVYKLRYRYVYIEGEADLIAKARLELDEMCLQRLEHKYNEEKGNAEQLVNYIHHIPEEVAEKMRFQRVFNEAMRRVERCGVQILHQQNRHTEEDNPPMNIHGRANRIREGKRCLDNFLKELANQKTHQIQIPMDIIGEICGHQRSTINEIERVTKTIIFVDPHSGEVEIEGGDMAIQDAEAQIRERIEWRQERIPKREFLEMEIPGNSISGIIGKRGSTINRIRKISGAKILIPNRAEPGERTATVSISGDREQIQKARIEIEYELEEMRNNNRASTTSIDGRIFKKMVQIDSRYRPVNGKRGGVMASKRSTPSPVLQWEGKKRKWSDGSEMFSLADDARTDVLRFCDGEVDAINAFTEAFISTYEPYFQGVRTVASRLREINRYQDALQKLQSHRGCGLGCEQLNNSLAIPQSLKDDIWREFHCGNDGRYCDVCCLMAPSDTFRKVPVANRLMRNATIAPMELCAYVCVCEQCQSIKKDVCHTCCKSLTQKKNGLSFDQDVPVLNKLNCIELMLINLSRVVQSVVHLKNVGNRASGMKGCGGPMIVLPTNLEKSIDGVLATLPSAEHMKIVVDTNWDRKYIVCMNRVLDALQWLKINNPEYANVKINPDFMFIVERDVLFEVGNCSQKDADQLVRSRNVSDGVLLKEGPSVTTVQTVSQPSHGSMTAYKRFKLLQLPYTPLGKDHPKADVWSFVNLFPRGLGGLRSVRTMKLSRRQYNRSVLLNSNNKLDLSDPEVAKTLSSVFNKIPEFKQYWAVVKNRLQFYCAIFGPPTWFVTLNPNVTMWTDLHDKYCKILAVEVNADNIWPKRVDAFHERVILAQDGPLGNVEHYYVRTEYQHRGLQHVHCLFWIKEKPGKDADAEEIGTFHDKYLTS